MIRTIHSLINGKCSLVIGACPLQVSKLSKYQAQAADLTEVDVVLDRQQLLPKYMRVWMPNRSHHVYIFHLNSAKKNSPLAMLQNLFQRPSVPFGWKRVVEDLPMQQAAQPQPVPR